MRPHDNQTNVKISFPFFQGKTPSLEIFMKGSIFQENNKLYKNLKTRTK